MEVILLTTLFSLAFAGFFLILFLRDRQVRRFGGVERDALMPLDDGDEPALSGHHHHGHSHGSEKCGCGGHGTSEKGSKKKSCQGCPCQH
ncbi:MAG: hypothetical protein KDL87_00625 [Verrucomicrobiae bacterium]|nr:hypothetical protein [Verrucomicrobiae bacterium]